MRKFGEEIDIEVEAEHVIVISSVPFHRDLELG
jgi:hypothetical protein